MTDKIGPLGDSLKPGSKSEGAEKNGSNGSKPAKRARKKSAGSSRLGNNTSTGKAKKPRKAAGSKSTAGKKRTTAAKTSKKRAASKKPATKTATEKAAAKKAVSKERQPTPTKKPPTSPTSTTKTVSVESDPDKTSVVNVKEELGKARPSLLDRLLDTSVSDAGSKKSAKPDDSSDDDSSPAASASSDKKAQVDDDLPLDAEKPDDLFSNLNRASKNKKSSSDDFEDLLLGGLSGSETSKVVKPASKSEHWTKQDHERPTQIPASKAGSAKKKPAGASSRVNAASTSGSKKPAKIDDDATDEIRGDAKNPIGRQKSRPAPPAPPAAKPKPAPNTAKDDAESTTIHDTPTGEIEVEPTKPEAATPSKAKTSDTSNVSSGVSAVRKRAQMKAEAAKKRLAETSTAEEDKDQSTAELLKENTTSTVQDKDEETKTSEVSSVSARKTEEIVEEPELEDGFESSELLEETELETTADVTGEIDRRGRGGFKVSTESVKQSLRPPPRVRARKVRRVIRHVDPWSVLTFSVLFHLTIFSSLLLGSVLIWQVAAASGTIENIEDVIKDLGSFETYELNGWAIFRAAVAVAAIFTLASTILVVIMSVIFNLISDLVGGIRVTVVQEETVRVQRDK